MILALPTHVDIPQIQSLIISLALYTAVQTRWVEMNEGLFALVIHN